MKKSTLSNIKMSLIVAVSVLVIGTVFTISVSNEAVSLEEQVNASYYDVKVQEKRRVDLIYNLVDTVKQYDLHEATTLKELVEARTSNGSNIDEVTTAIQVTAESYPELKSSENYKQLMSELSITENMIAQYRSNYNLQVKKYNRFTKRFPTSLVLSITNYEVSDMNYIDFDAPSDSPQNLFEE